MEHFCVKIGDHSCFGFQISCGYRQTAVKTYPGDYRRVKNQKEKKQINSEDTCRPRGCENRLEPFPGRTSYKRPNELTRVNNFNVQSFKRTISTVNLSKYLSDTYS